MTEIVDFYYAIIAENGDELKLYCSEHGAPLLFTARKDAVKWMKDHPINFTDIRAKAVKVESRLIAVKNARGSRNR